MLTFVIILGLVALDFTNAFSLEKSEPETQLVVKEGESFQLSCTVDGYYEYCKFVHKDEICDFAWIVEQKDITIVECNDYEGRMEWSGDAFYKCAMTIHNAQPKDAGAWKCEIESYAPGKDRGYGSNVTADFDIKINAHQTTSNGS